MRFCVLITLVLIGCFVSTAFSDTECNQEEEEKTFDKLFNKLQSYIKDPDARKTIQKLNKESVHSAPKSCDLNCQKKNLYNTSIRGHTKLKSQVSGKVGDLLTKIIAAEYEAFDKFNEVSPKDTAAIKGIGCTLLSNKNKLMREFYGSS